MSVRQLASVFAIVSAVTFAQAPQKAEKAWTAPHLADGHPDLQGVWTNATLTPLQRLPQFANKATLTEAEAKEGLSILTDSLTAVNEEAK